MSPRPGARPLRVRRLLTELGLSVPAAIGWRERAVCREVDPELFYPVGTGAWLDEQVAEAKQVCAGCPVRRVCLADAMASEDPGLRWGVLGGLSPVERAELFATYRQDGGGVVKRAVA